MKLNLHDYINANFKQRKKFSQNSYWKSTIFNSQSTKVNVRNHILPYLWTEMCNERAPHPPALTFSFLPCFHAALKNK